MKRRITNKGSVGNDKSTGIPGNIFEANTDKGVKKTTVSKNNSKLIKANQDISNAKGIRIPKYNSL